MKLTTVQIGKVMDKKQTVCDVRSLQYKITKDKKRIFYEFFGSSNVKKIGL